MHADDWENSKHEHHRAKNLYQSKNLFKNSKNYFYNECEIKRKAHAILAIFLLNFLDQVTDQEFLELRIE